MIDKPSINNIDIILIFNYFIKKIKCYCTFIIHNIKKIYVLKINKNNIILYLKNLNSTIKTNLYYK